MTNCRTGYNDIIFYYIENKSLMIFKMLAQDLQEKGVNKRNSVKTEKKEQNQKKGEQQQ